ncbi:sulfurtransferase-like selenium metabolism protein YedF [Peptoniphilus equinus]|uniref:Sulfurtransferase-like selenium metabolism protein YedF n=1 Tax=Peptoniphilus equinus TaxID=3016343 RepID=A0ABY7QWJ5_9FIRM|nr:sulfurtransferase-like selenium metabolism protein YedF [Peptoniphilus equinus]WBW50588.1 sulfurtransferase-like selenium metabolism protein YedF [Peptoniphilus equinus]
MEINALGKVCPIPVILAKKALREQREGDVVEVLVDNVEATHNLKKLAEQESLDYDVVQEADERFRVTLTASGKEKKQELTQEEYAVLLDADEFGKGESGFAKSLMETFVYSLTEQDIVPSIVICVNEGVRLSTENEKTVEDLKKLEANGTEVISCGLCLDNYGLKDKLAVGQITNMFRITEILRTYKVISF